MRKILVMCLILSCLMSLIGCIGAPAPQTGGSAAEAGSKEVGFVPDTPTPFKGLWLSQWDMKNVYASGGVQREKEDFSAHIEAIMERAAALGFNAILVQVRPFGDSFYPSDLYPPSFMAVGEYGREFSYDPFEIIVKKAHEARLSIQAWINPLRLMKEEEIALIDPSYTVRKWYDDETTRGSYLVLQPDGRFYLNPGYAQVRDLIVSGAREILERYEIDGLHMDDYFYPTTEEDFDRACFTEAKAAGSELDLAAFRRASLNRLVRALYETTHKTRPGAVFGIAPGGNLDDAYLCQYADIYTWCGEDACVDYICPEIYFGFEHEFCPFDKTAQKWSEIVKNPDVKLYLGLSFHKSGLAYDPYAGSGENEWATHSDIVARSLVCATALSNCAGVCVFCYGHFYDALTGEEPEWTKAERDNFLIVFRDAVFIAA